MLCAQGLPSQDNEHDNDSCILTGPVMRVKPDHDQLSLRADSASGSRYTVLKYATSAFDGLIEFREAKCGPCKLAAKTL